MHLIYGSQDKQSARSGWLFLRSCCIYVLLPGFHYIFTSSRRDYEPPLVASPRGYTCSPYQDGFPFFFLPAAAANFRQSAFCEHYVISLFLEVWAPMCPGSLAGQPTPPPTQLENEQKIGKIGNSWENSLCPLYTPNRTVRSIAQVNQQ